MRRPARGIAAGLRPGAPRRSRRPAPPGWIIPGRRAAAAALGLALAGVPRPAVAQDFQVVEATIRETQAAMRAGTLTCRGLVEAYLRRIEAYDGAGPHLNAVQAVHPRALALADSLDRHLASGGEPGPLHCVPVHVKDQVETREMPTTFGSALFAGFLSDRDATVVRRVQEAGGIVLAKNTMGELASGYVGSGFGFTRNPYDPTRNPSGSSGGTAVAVAANLGMVGIGEDTGGSIRGPAAVTNLVGLRPTLGLVSTWGMMPSNPTQDTMGPLARTVTDAALLLDVLAGYDPETPLTAYAVGRIPRTYTEELDAGALRGARIGVLRYPQDRRTDPGSEDYTRVRAVLDRALGDLRAAGAEVLDSIAFPEMELVRGIGNVYETERAADEYLAQLSDPPYTRLSRILISGRVNPWRARGMTGLLGQTPDDPGYLAVVHRREALRQGLLKAMADHDLDAVVYATFDHQPTPIAPDVETNPDPDDRYGWGSNRTLAPAVGFPALTLPAGFTSDALPVGMELLGRPFSEATLLGYGYAYEQATGHRRPPPSAPPLGPR